LKLVCKKHWLLKMISPLTLAVLLMAVTVQAVDIEVPPPGSWRSGALCSSYACLYSKGYFTSQHFWMNSFFPFSAEKKLYSFQSTNFVVVIRPLTEQFYSSNGLKICAGWTCEDFSASQSHVRVYEDVREVKITLNDPTLRFEIQYYSGCDILDGTAIDVAGDTSESLNSCWLMIPRIFEGSNIQHTKRTYAMIDKINIAENSTLVLSDMITGMNIARFTNSSTTDLFQMEQADKGFTYTVNGGEVSTVLMLESVPCNHKVACNHISFNLQLGAMSPNDVNCIRNEAACELGTGDCEPSDDVVDSGNYTQCTTVRRMLNRFDPVEEEDSAAGVNGVNIYLQAIESSLKKVNNVLGRLWKGKNKRCMKLPPKSQRVRFFCKAPISCRKYKKKGCAFHNTCWFIRNIQKLCDRTSLTMHI